MVMAVCRPSAMTMLVMSDHGRAHFGNLREHLLPAAWPNVSLINLK
jgi:hypothetical protein